MGTWGNAGKRNQLSENHRISECRSHGRFSGYAVFHATSRVEEFDLGNDFCIELTVLTVLLKRHEWGIAHQLKNVLVNHNLFLSNVLTMQSYGEYVYSPRRIGIKENITVLTSIDRKYDEKNARFSIIT